MAIVGTGKWEQKSTESNSSVQNRDYYSGVLAVSNSTYDGTHKLEFGFAAVGIIIRNGGANALAFQWLRHDGEVVDNGTVPATEEIIIEHNLNKQGVSLRVDGAATTDVEVIAWG